MKIVKRIDFLMLPENTVFSEYEPCWFGPLMIKGETVVDVDWYEQSIADGIDFSNTQEFADKLLRAQETGESIGMDFDCEHRDGSFDPPDRLYAVWEPQDVQHLINRLKRCLPPGDAGEKHG